MEGCQVNKNEKETKSVKFIVDSLDCQSCASDLEKQILALEGVIDVDILVDSRQVFVDYESDKTRDEAIKKVIEESGYRIA